MPITKEEKERRMTFARQEAALAWCEPSTEKIVMDPILAEAFAGILVEHMYEPHMGCASTEEILDELRTRIELDGKLGYKSVPDDGEDYTEEPTTVLGENK